jgi:hypothetical protein
MASTGSSFSAEAPETGPARGPVVAGLLTFQDADTVAAVATAIRDGLDSRFARVDNRIVLVDAGSSDGTMARARDSLAGANYVEATTNRSTADLLEVPYHGLPGKARAIHAVLTAARDLGARACVVFDGGVSTVSPGWVTSLVSPVIDRDLDFVSAFYARHRFEGALTTAIVYPVVRALYGVRLRQPATAEFACSSRFVEHALGENVWNHPSAQVGIDVWLATAAASGGFRIGEAEVGLRAHGSRGEEGLDLGATIAQVVGALFTDLERRAAIWQRPRTLAAAEHLAGGATAPAPPPGPVDVERLIETFRLGYRELRDLWASILPPLTILDLKHLVAASGESFVMNDQLWARIVYDFALGCRLRVVAREHLLRSLAPLYSGWLASYILQVRNVAPEAVDQRVETIAAAFESQKNYLIARWRWPERRRSG